MQGQEKLSKVVRAEGELCRCNQNSTAMENKERTFRKTAATVIALLAICPTLLFGLLLPWLLVLFPIIALMVYGIVVASYQLVGERG